MENEEQHKETWNLTKGSNTYIIGGQERQSSLEQKAIFEKLTTSNFSIQKKDISSHVQEVQ